MEMIRQVVADANSTQILAFLYICENEGLNVSELTQLLQTTNATASRTASSLENGVRDAGGPGLVVSAPGERHAHSRVLRLSPRGRALRDRIDGLIRDAITIVPQP